MKNKGFTLIELLVVIAIIGILSSVVLASLNSARGKGSDAAVKGGMESLRSQAALYYDSNGQAYEAAGVNNANCIPTAGVFNDPQVKSIIANISTNASGIACTSSPSAYAVRATLKGGSGTGYWCVDSSGVASATPGQWTNGLCQ
jgi:prepilin-type N-terminal cleavage/methylation domain-containing protein